METKICNTCGEEKPLTEFNFRDKRKGIYRAQCKECLHKRKNELYKLKYRERYKDKIKENKKRHREYIRNLIASLKSKGCCVCGETDECCLDFHHLYNKEFTISHNLDVTEKALLEEINKCVILCANCHRKLHAGKLSLSGDEPDGPTTTSLNTLDKSILSILLLSLSYVGNYRPAVVKRKGS